MKSNTNQIQYKQDTTCEYIEHNDALSATLLHHYHQSQILITITVKEHRVLLKIKDSTRHANSLFYLAVLLKVKLVHPGHQ